MIMHHEGKYAYAVLGPVYHKVCIGLVREDNEAVFTRSRVHDRYACHYDREDATLHAWGTPRLHDILAR